ncbi:unnamed protein product [Heligmosomoides polygyrus]|uniref:WS_DGAT_C domain-containing protein n=1 Tax=Heligmosomoides polygyrus TaxID=6339 RepID=A0A183FPD2_HELPZ|nr:unnamed protein product [Heligmosomoides polygyrus]
MQDMRSGDNVTNEALPRRHQKSLALPYLVKVCYAFVCIYRRHGKYQSCKREPGLSPLRYAQWQIKSEHSVVLLSPAYYVSNMLLKPYRAKMGSRILTEVLNNEFASCARRIFLEMHVKMNQGSLRLGPALLMKYVHWAIPKVQVHFKEDVSTYEKFMTLASKPNSIEAK